MEKTKEKIREEINTFETRLKSAFEYIKDMEQFAATQGTPVTDNEQYNKIKSQIPRVEDRLRTLYAELEELGASPAPAAPPTQAAPAPAAPAPTPKPAPPAPPAQPQPQAHPGAHAYQNMPHYAHQPHQQPHHAASAPFITTVPMDANMSATTTMGLSAESLTKRGFALLEDEEWVKAHEKFDNALDIDMEYSRAYIGLLCTELRITNEKKLANQNILLAEHKYFNKALRYADRDYRVMLETFNQINQDRLEEQRASAPAPAPVPQPPLPAPAPAPKAQPAPPPAPAPAPAPKAQAPAAQAGFVPEVEQRKPGRPVGPLTEEQKLQLRQAEKKRKDDLENAQIEEEQQYRKNQREWMKKGLCFYCGGKLTLVKKCKSCGKTNF